MKIKLPFIKKYISIYKRYTYTKIIIPIGCDCHPAHSLQDLGLRKFSLPLDWLNIDPRQSLNYFLKNYNENFYNFYKNPIINKNGHYISSAYPEAEFIHEKRLDTRETQSKIDRRISRLLETISSNNVIFVNCLPLESIRSNNDIITIIRDINNFKKHFVHLHIYLRYDDDSTLRNPLHKELQEQLNLLNVNHTLYYRNQKVNGMWGNPKENARLMKDMGIPIKISFPKIKLN